VVVNDRRITVDQAARYAQEGAQQIGIEHDSLEGALNQSTQIIRANLLEEGEKVRHDSTLLAQVVMSCQRQASTRPVPA
jgi:hypothetical protein